MKDHQKTKHCQKMLKTPRPSMGRAPTTCVFWLTLLPRVTFSACRTVQLRKFSVDICFFRLGFIGDVWKGFRDVHKKLELLIFLTNCLSKFHCKDVPETKYCQNCGWFSFLLLLLFSGILNCVFLNKMFTQTVFSSLVRHQQKGQCHPPPGASQR